MSERPLPKPGSVCQSCFVRAATCKVRLRDGRLQNRCGTCAAKHNPSGFKK